MLRPILPLVLLITTPAVLTACPQGARKTEPPPGMVLIEGGPTKLGMRTKDVVEMMEKDEKLQDIARALWSMTPEHTVKVGDFFLMVTQVTNEQYAAFVRATGAKPPQHWGEKAITDAGARFLAEEGRRREEAKERGEPVPERKEFDRPAWWQANWKGAQWEIPKGYEHHPVVYVDYQDAAAYARWAGVRLMTEEEYVRAVRKGSLNLYPWGDEWSSNPPLALTSELARGRKAEAMPVGSFPDGASPEGVYDLAGNIWEWTSSPFNPFPKWKMETLEFGKGRNKHKVDTTVQWDPNERVAVGGSFQNDPLASMCIIRRGTERRQSTNGVGFRCAASTQPGVDMSNTVFKDDLPPDARPTGVRFEVNSTIAMDRWDTVPASVKGDEAGIAESGKDKDEKSKPPIPPPGYQVIAGYDYLLFTPVEQVDVVGKDDLGKKVVAGEEIAWLGYFSTTQPILEPALGAGAYMIGFRHSGEVKKRKEKKNEEGEEGEKGKEGGKPEKIAGQEQGEAEPVQEEKPTLAEKLQLDTKRHHLIFFDARREPVGVVPVDDYAIEKLSPGSIGIVTVHFKEPVLDEEGNPVLDEKKKPMFKEWDEKRLRFKLSMNARAPRKVFQVELDLKVDEDQYGKAWRLP